MDGDDSEAERPTERPPCVLCVRVTTERAGRVRVELVGEVDLTTVEQVRRALTEALAVAARVDVDLCAVRFLGAAGLSALIEARTAAERRDGVLRVARPPSAVRRLLSVTGTTGLLGTGR